MTSEKFVKVPRLWQEALANIRADGTTYRLAFYLLDRATWMWLVHDLPCLQHTISREYRYRRSIVKPNPVANIASSLA